MKKASVPDWSSKIYRNGLSRRILVAKETLHKTRSTKPLLIVHLEGTIGFYDENKFFYLREKSLAYLSALSHNFRIVALSYESKSITKRLLNHFSNVMSNSKGFTFDAVYVLKKHLSGGRLNCSHILLDHAEEIGEGQLEIFASSKVIILTSDPGNLVLGRLDNDF